MKRSSNKLIVILVFINIILLGFAGFIGYKYFQKPKMPERTITHTELQEDSITTLIVQDKVPYKLKLTFNEAILGAANQKKELIIMTQDISSSYTTTKDGLFNWGVFKQQKAMVFHGKGRYTVDLSGIDADDISVDNATRIITIHIPEPQLSVEYLPEKTEFFDTKNGLLSFGEMELTPEMMTDIEIVAKEQLNQALSANTEVNEMAKRFAILSVEDIYQPIITAFIDNALKEANDPYATVDYYIVKAVIDD